MAVIDYSETVLVGPKSDPKAIVIAWEGLANGDTGKPISMVEHADRSIEFTGTFSTGGEIVLEGNNSGSATVYTTLTDYDGAAIDKTSADYIGIRDIARQVRPNVTAGDGSTSLNAYLVLRK
jgi:hypothetical protein